MKKRIFIFCPYPKGEAPSQRFRFEQYLAQLEKDGFEIEYDSFLSADNWRDIYQKAGFLSKMDIMLKAWWGRVKAFKKLKNTDYIFIHREMAQWGPPIFEWILAKIYKKQFIYDFDDAIWLPNYSESNKWVHRIKWYGKVKYIIKWADQVVVGNSYLQSYALQFNKNVVVIPTTIDLRSQHVLTTNYHSEKQIIGWTGTHTTMNYLDELIPVIEKLELEFDFEFRVISNQAPKFDLKSLRFVEWNKETEIQDLAEINIGIMPLVEDEWSKGKCGFKALQYMALGIPSVISPVGVNTEIIQQEENGFLAKSPEAFYLHLKRLLNDKKLRLLIGQKGKETIKERYSVDANYKHYLNLFKK